MTSSRPLSRERSSAERKREGTMKRATKRQGHSNRIKSELEFDCRLPVAFKEAINQNTSLQTQKGVF
jgi:hypothetical protein